MRVSLVRLGMLALLGSPACSGAQDLDAGWEGDRAQGYSYARLLVPVGWLGHHALVTGLESDYLYDSWIGDSARVDFRSAGAALLLGYRYRTMHYVATLASGYQGSWTLAPALPIRGRGVMVLAELSLDLAPATELSAAAIYEDAGRYSWARAGVGRRIVRTLRGGEERLLAAIGPEGTVERTPDDRSLGMGGLLAIEHPTSGSSLEFRAGPRWSRDGRGSSGTGRYLGVAISHDFGD